MVASATSNRDFRLLLASQFLGAFGDNAVLAVILGQLTFQRRDDLISEARLGEAGAIYAGLFFIPYVVLAPLAGYLNDRFAKTRWLLGGNVIKIIGTLLAASSVWLGHFWQGLGYLIVGVGACIYSPAKYGVLPEIVPQERLVKANGAVEFLTLIAILTGNVGGARMIDRLPVLPCYCILVAVFAASLGLNLLMSRTPAHLHVRLRASADEFFSNLGDLLASPRLFRILCGTCMFWVCGAVLKMNLQRWGLDVLRLTTNTEIAMLSLWLSLGIMAGAMLAGRLHRVGNLQWTRRYAYSMAALIYVSGIVDFLLDAGFLAARWPVAILLILCGGMAGLFLVPLNAALQSECDQARLGKTVAAQNFVDNIGMLAASGLVFMGVKGGLSSSGVFICLSICLALVAMALKMPPKPGEVASVRAFQPDI
jgi:LPLT family lysophospholipid transporter-like MFS transporter